MLLKKMRYKEEIVLKDCKTFVITYNYGIIIMAFSNTHDIDLNA